MVLIVSLVDLFLSSFWAVLMELSQRQIWEKSVTAANGAWRTPACIKHLGVLPLDLSVAWWGLYKNAPITRVDVALAFRISPRQAGKLLDSLSLIDSIVCQLGWQTVDCGYKQFTVRILQVDGRQTVPEPQGLQEEMTRPALSISRKEWQSTCLSPAKRPRVNQPSLCIIEGCAYTREALRHVLSVETNQLYLFSDTHCFYEHYASLAISHLLISPSFKSIGDSLALLRWLCSQRAAPHIAVMPDRQVHSLTMALLREIGRAHV